MEIKQQLMADLKAAMKSGDKETRNAIRMIQAAIKQVEVDGGEKLDNEGAMAVVQKQAKQRRESIAEYGKAGREDLADPEKAELAVIQKYLPAMMEKEEIEKLASTVISDLGVSDMKSMGQVMGKLMPQVKGKADGRLVNQVVRDLLQSS